MIRACRNDLKSTSAYQLAKLPENNQLSIEPPPLLPISATTPNLAIEGAVTDKSTSSCSPFADGPEDAAGLTPEAIALFQRQLSTHGVESQIATYQIHHLMAQLRLEASARLAGQASLCLLIC